MGRDGRVTTQTTTQDSARGPRLATRQPSPLGEGRPTKFVAHFPSPRPSLSAKVRPYLLPLPYRPQGERSISSFLRCCKPSCPISPLASRYVREGSKYQAAGR